MFTHTQLLSWHENVLSVFNDRLCASFDWNYFRKLGYIAEILVCTLCIRRTLPGFSQKQLTQLPQTLFLFLMRIGSGATLVVSGDGRYYSKDAIQVQIIQFDSKGNIDCLIQ